MENITDVIPSSPANPERVQFYQRKAQELFDKYGKDFDEFVKNETELVRRGNELLHNSECSGYDIVLSAKDMMLTSKKDLLFYSNYIRRTKHFGLSLAEMEQRKIIIPEQVRFGVEASKVRYEETKERDGK